MDWLSEYREDWPARQSSHMGIDLVQHLEGAASSRTIRWSSDWMCGKPPPVQSGAGTTAAGNEPRVGFERGSRNTKQGRSLEGGAMRKSKYLAGVALLSALTLVAGACSKKTPTTSGPKAGALGAVTVAAGAPIKVAVIESISGDTASLGNDQVRGVQIAVDDKGGKLLGHSITLVGPYDDKCAADGGTYVGHLRWPTGYVQCGRPGSNSNQSGAGRDYGPIPAVWHAN